MKGFRHRPDIRFNKKGATATVTGNLTTLDSCDVIKENDSDFKESLSVIIEKKKEFANNKNKEAQKEIQELESKLSSI